MTFIEETVSVYNEKLKTCLNTYFNLSKHSFFLNTYKLLNKNLNFVPTSKQYSQKQLNIETENVFRLLKLRAHFKDANETQTSDQLYRPFKFKTKQNGRLKKHITLSKLS